MSQLGKLRRRIERANRQHRCAACGDRLDVLTPEQDAQARREAYAQGMTDEQLADPTYAAKICDPCWQKAEAVRRMQEGQAN